MTQFSNMMKYVVFATAASARWIIYYILEQSNKTILEFSKGTTKVL